MPVSNAAAAGAAMLAHKRIPHRVVRLMPGLHPLLVRLAGFEGFTVPALELDLNYRTRHPLRHGGQDLGQRRYLARTERT